MVTTVAQAKRAAKELGGRVVVKAQIHAGGRGKGRLVAKAEDAPKMYAQLEAKPATTEGQIRGARVGGVRLVDTPQRAGSEARKILGKVLVTHQTRPQGRKVQRLLIEEQSAVAHEYYASVLIDSAIGTPVLIASAEGGQAIEEVAARNPKAILRIPVDPAAGFPPYKGRQLAKKLGIPPETILAAGNLFAGLYDAFIRNDASIAEINPLVVTEDNRVLALDAKITLDDNAAFRQPFADLRDKGEEDPMEIEAAAAGIGSYIKLSGSIGCMVNGAGLAMATLDSIKLAGGDAANFLDIGTVNRPGAGGGGAAHHQPGSGCAGDPRQYLRRHGAGGHHRAGGRGGAAASQDQAPHRGATGRVEHRGGLGDPATIRSPPHPCRRPGRRRPQGGHRRRRRLSQPRREHLGGPSVSILISRRTQVMVQGLGGEGQNQIKRSLAYGTTVVAGVHPGFKGGASFEGFPVYDTVEEAVAKEKPTATIIFVPAPGAADAILENIAAQAPLIVCITEGVPVQDMVRVKAALATSKSRLLGPNCPGLITPGGKCRIGIMPAATFTPGLVGVISRSGTLVYEAVSQLSALGIGQSTCVGAGGDPIIVQHRRRCWRCSTKTRRPTPWC